MKEGNRKGREGAEASKLPYIPTRNAHGEAARVELERINDIRWFLDREEARIKDEMTEVNNG